MCIRDSFLLPFALFAANKEFRHYPAEWWVRAREKCPQPNDQFFFHWKCLLDACMINGMTGFILGAIVSAKMNPRYLSEVPKNITTANHAKRGIIMLLCCGPLALVLIKMPYGTCLLYTSPSPRDQA
eukprot:TRINITY_DN7760_c0_g1_i2.p2 TRINITY_DN7760_c0_g1~~TRINITY_DN7760_c0_g1_i2.p2  ORF type:complete len:147 (+),score=21.10 TRINITY_DN7760_c0_g1_i2:61-441(+)